MFCEAVRLCCWKAAGDGPPTVSVALYMDVPVLEPQEGNVYRPSYPFTAPVIPET